MQYGSAGVGSANQLACVLLNAAIGVTVTHVPYRGGEPAMQDLMAGRIDYVCTIITTALPQIEGGLVKAIAITTRNRSPLLPDLATAQEQGLKDFEAYTWNAFFMPKGTPDADRAPAQRRHRGGAQHPAGAAAAPATSAPPWWRPSAARRNISPSSWPSEIDKWAGPIRASGASVD